MKRLPFISIIVLNFNGESFLKECFESLSKLEYPHDRFEVIMGDNASTDNSVAYTRKYYPWIRVIEFEYNYGFCKSNNKCAKQAQGLYLVFLNNDTYVDKNWLKELVAGVLAEPGTLSCASKILFPHLKKGTIINAAGGVIFPSGCGLYEGWMADDAPDFNIKKYTGFGCGAGVLIQKDFFLQTGGFDEYYFYSGEEMDLGFRAWLSGYKVFYNPLAVMYHYMGKTGFRGKGVTPTIEFLVVRNNLYFILKNFEWYMAIEGFLLFELKALLKIGYALVQRNFPICKSIVKAHLHILKDIRKIRKSRLRVQKLRKVSDRNLRKFGIITTSIGVFQRYAVGMKNIKRFAQGSFYDNKDAVKLKKNKRGEFYFHKPS
jgi:GT2 family glycosyltransferase